MIKFLYFLLLTNVFVAWAVKTPLQSTKIISANSDQMAQATANAQQLAAQGHQVVMIPQVTQSWMRWLAQQAEQRRQDPRLLYIEEDDSREN